MHTAKLKNLGFDSYNGLYYYRQSIPTLFRIIIGTHSPLPEHSIVEYVQAF